VSVELLGPFRANGRADQVDVGGSVPKLIPACARTIRGPLSRGSTTRRKDRFVVSEESESDGSLEAVRPVA
jgi:hypothetical protein